MTNRECMLAIMDGKSPDRIPWIPRLLIWHKANKLRGTLPERYRDYSLRDIERDLNMGNPSRDGRIFTSKMTGVEVETRSLNKMESITEYRTPAGTLTSLARGSELLRSKGIGDLEVEHMLKGPDDYDVMAYIIEHTEYEETFESYAAYETEDVAEDGVPLVACGDCPFHHWLQKHVGYNNGYFHLNDFPQKVERLLALMEDIDRRVVWPLMEESPANLLLHGVHFDSNITPPPKFEQYIKPYYQDLSERLHQRGKKLCMHADADSRKILGLIRDSGFDMAETFTTEPMVPCTLAEAREAFAGRVIIWGGVPSVILESAYSDEYFEDYMDKLFKTISPGDAFILGVADNVMPEAKIERLRRISEMVEERGTYPVQ